MYLTEYISATITALYFFSLVIVYATLEYIGVPASWIHNQWVYMADIAIGMAVIIGLSYKIEKKINAK
jgi:hypothetical protein